MDLAEIYRVMRRRWYILLPGLLLTAALTVGAYLEVPVTYQSQSTVVLLNSQKATVAFDGNPFLSTQLALNGMADSLARNLNSDASITYLKAQGANSTTVAKIADNALGPLMWLTASGSNQHDVLAADRLLTTYAGQRLEQFQVDQSVRPQAMIRMATIVPPQNPVAQTKTRYEYLAAAAVLGIVISMIATFYVEARNRTVSRGRSRSADRRRAADPPQADEEGAGTSGAQAEKPPATARHAPRWSMSGAPDSGASADTAGADTEATDTDAHRFV